MLIAGVNRPKEWPGEGKEGERDAGGWIGSH